MKKLSRLAPLTFFAPFLALAQQPGNFTGFANFIGNITVFLNNTVVPFVFAIAFIVFIWGVFKAFILGGGDSEKQKEGRQLMGYALVGFVIMVSVWGLVNFIAGSLGFDEQTIRNIPNLPIQNN